MHAADMWLENLVSYSSRRAFAKECYLVVHQKKSSKTRSDIWRMHRLNSLLCLALATSFGRIVNDGEV